MMKILILITAYSLAFLCLGCKTIDERDSQRQHKQFKIIGLYKDMFRGSILLRRAKMRSPATTGLMMGLKLLVRKNLLKTTITAAKKLIKKPSESDKDKG